MSNSRFYSKRERQLIKKKNFIQQPVITKIKEKVVFNQPFGIGDIMFIEPIMRKFFIEGYEIILPCLEKYKIFQRNMPYINFVDKAKITFNYDEKSITKKEDTTTYPVRWSKEFFNSTLYETMSNKYKMFNLPLEKWREFTFLRFRNIEDELIKLLDLNIKEDYTLLVTDFHSYNNKKRNIKIKNNNKIVELKPTEGYTLLDWATIIENASEIHSVNTSTLYLFETLNLKTDIIHLYSRNDNGEGFKNTEYLRTKNYKLYD